MNHRTTRRTVAVALVVLTPFAAAACGDDAVDTPADAVTTTEAKSEDTMTDDSMKDDDTMTDDSMKDDSMTDEGR